jgi:hypothetical protein
MSPHSSTFLAGLRVSSQEPPQQNRDFPKLLWYFFYAMKRFSSTPVVLISTQTATRGHQHGAEPRRLSKAPSTAGHSPGRKSLLLLYNQLLQEISPLTETLTDRVMHGVSANSPLPPSVETAYYRKCIELKRRITEIEDNNDAQRLKKLRIERAILKMRLERAMLLEQIAEKMAEHNPDDSDESNSPPPTVGDLVCRIPVSLAFDQS